jgi:hypothetical protein
MGDTATNRATVAHLNITDGRGRFRQEWAVLP